MATKGGRIAPDGRPPQAKGLGKNAKRHDLERPATPGLHGSDLQQGDVQAMEQGQRIAPAQTQAASTSIERRPDGSQVQRSTEADGTQTSSLQIPDAIDFLGDRSRNGNEFQPVQARRTLDSSRALTWMPLLRHLVNGPNASSALVNAFINQARAMQMAGSVPATIVDMNAADDGIEAMIAAMSGEEGDQPVAPEQPVQVDSEEIGEPPVQQATETGPTEGP